MWCWICFIYYFCVIFFLQNDNFVRVDFFSPTIPKSILRCATFQQKRNTNNLKQLKNTLTKKNVKNTHFVGVYSLSVC